MKRYKVLKDRMWVIIDANALNICVKDVKAISHGKKSKLIIKSSVVAFEEAQTFINLFSGLSQKKKDGKFCAMIATGIKLIQEKVKNENSESIK